ncbi:MAG TPA: diacylglycerol kinase family protein [Gaiellaceae bacterium]|nr:diacylglycerol kinase family protein [Gaiellaceae bacterium]
MSTAAEPIEWTRPSAAARAAAAVALLTMASVFLLIFAGVTRETGAVFFAFAFVFLAAFAGWFVLTRRRFKRALGIVGIIVAFSGLAGFVQHHYLLLGMLFAAIAVFGFTARYAVRHDAALRPEVDQTRRRTRRSTCKGVLIINPKSGDGKAERWELSDEAVKRGIEPVVLRPGDDVAELAELAVEDGANVIGMAGGDGSQALVATVAMRHQVAHVCVPAGTRNHFALDLGLDRNDVVGALDAFTDGVERRIDLARVNEQVFVNNASLGLYANVVQSDAYRTAKLRTWNRLLPRMLGPNRAETMNLQFRGPDGRSWADAALVVVSNNAYQVRRLGGIGSRYRMDGGQLGIVVTRIRRAIDFAQLVTFGSAGQHKRFRGLRQWAALEFEVDSDRPVAVGLDGEAFVLTPPLRFVSLPGALRVRIPKHARGVSPAGLAVTLTRRDLRRLIRIAAGRSRHTII